MVEYLIAKDFILCCFFKSSLWDSFNNLIILNIIDVIENEIFIISYME